MMSINAPVKRNDTPPAPQAQKKNKTKKKEDGMRSATK